MPFVIMGRISEEATYLAMVFLFYMYLSDLIKYDLTLKMLVTTIDALGHF